MRRLVSFAACILLAVTVPQAVVGQEREWLSTPESVRAFREQVEAGRPETTRFPLASVEDRRISLDGREIEIRIYDPGTGAPPSPVLLYLHGACWVAGSLDSHDEVSRYLASESGAVVVAVDYRLAPEDRYPAAHEDVWETARWIWEHAEELGVDRGRFAIGGESAGAHLAAATAVRAMDEQGPEFALLLLIYAALDGGGSSWAPCKSQYFATVEDARSRYGSPLWVEDLAKMPPTFNVYGQWEPSRAEQELFVRKLREQGVEAHSFMTPGVGHDVGTWLSVVGDLTAHEMVIEYLEAGWSGSR